MRYNYFMDTCLFFLIISGLYMISMADTLFKDNLVGFK